MLYYSLASSFQGQQEFSISIGGALEIIFVLYSVHCSSWCVHPFVQFLKAAHLMGKFSVRYKDGIVGCSWGL